MSKQASPKKKRKLKYGKGTPHDVGANDSEQEGQHRYWEDARALAQLEAEDLKDLNLIAATATRIDFDDRTGCRIPSKSEKNSNDSPIQGLMKISKTMLDQNLLRDLDCIHAIIKDKVARKNMVPWAGVGGDTSRLRAFGFLGSRALVRLTRYSPVRLHAPEKVGIDAEEDELANKKAISVLNPSREYLSPPFRDPYNQHSNGDRNHQIPKKTINPTLVAKKLCEVILAGKSSATRTDGPDPNILSPRELIAYQTNLHNGAQHLAAHLDAPLHEGFGKIIVTVAIKGGATILLIGKGKNDTDSDGECDQPSWKFHLSEGEAYVLTGNVRNVCLHAVLAENDGHIGGGSNRESLNLRFGLHSEEEAEEEIKRHWPDLW